MAEQKKEQEALYNFTKATVVAAEFPTAIILNSEKVDVNFIADVIQKLEQNNDFVQTVGEFVDKVNKIIRDIVGNDLFVIVVPTILPQTEKEYAKLTDDYVKAALNAKSAGEMKQIKIGEEKQY